MSGGTATEAPPTNGASAAASAAAAAAAAAASDTATTPNGDADSAPKKRVVKRKATKVTKAEATKRSRSDETGTAVKKAPPKSKGIPDSGSESEDPPETPKPKRAPRRRVVPSSSSSSSAAAAAAAAAVVKPSKEEEEEEEGAVEGLKFPSTAEVIGTPRRELTAAVLDDLIPRLIASQRGESDKQGFESGRKIVFLSAMALQPILEAYCGKRDTYNATNIYKKLATTREEIESADLILVATHGPHVEYDQVQRTRWGDGRQPNNHWSLIAYSPSEKEAYHYDSLPTMNISRAAEIMGVLRHYGLVDRDACNIHVPKFFPSQAGVWECGYFVLAAVIILAQKTRALPLTEDDVDAYKPYFDTIAIETPGQCVIRNHLTDLLQVSAYASLAP